jgi:hypothetical protein
MRNTDKAYCANIQADYFADNLSVPKGCCRNSKALNAWFWVELATLRVVARYEI